MERSLRVGNSLFGTGMIAFGAVILVRLDLLPDLEPMPAWVPLRLLWACLSGVVLVASGVAILLDRRMRMGATAVAALFSIWVLVLHLPRVVLDPLNGGAWVVTYETLALSAAAWTLAAMLARDEAPVHGFGAWLARGNDGVRLAARVCFGLSFLAFGASHFVYRAYVEQVIPGWIPGHQFWAVATGLAHLAAGASILVNVKARLASTMLAIMFGSWVILVHLPLVAANPSKPNQWTSLIIALACSGASLIIGSGLTRESLRASAVAPVRVPAEPFAR